MNTNGNNLRKKINVEKAKDSLEKLFLIYKDISFNADEISKKRCPYKDAKSTSEFECLNVSGGRLGKLDIIFIYLIFY